MLGSLWDVRWTGRLVVVMPLVIVLAGAVLLMHSLPAAGGHSAAAPAMATAYDMSPLADDWDRAAPVAAGEDPAPGHPVVDLAHLCLAILTVLLVGLVRALTLRGVGLPGGTAVGSGQSGERPTARPPPKAAGRFLLSSLCTLRV